jgi:phospholipid transport system substrate-binding protein
MVMKPREDRTRCGDGARRRRWSTALVVLVAAVSLGTPPALSGEAVKEEPPTESAGRARPLDVVKASVSRVLAIVQPPYVVASDGGQRRTAIRRVAQGLFDFNEMARLTLARHWKDRSAQEQEEFIRLFTDLLERSYLTTIENYAGEKITFLGESVSGPYAQVRSRIITDRRVEISIEYRLHRLLESDARWAVYDVVLDGVSLVSNYRSQFNSIIRLTSFADVLTRLRNKEIKAHVIPRMGHGS